MLAQETTGDPALGQKVFAKCQVCHVIGEGAKNKVGPELNGLIGRKPGSLEDFKYSKAMIEFGQDHVWDKPTLTEYLHAPRKVVKGTKMAFAGLRKDDDIGNLLAYLTTFDPSGAAAGK